MNLDVIKKCYITLLDDYSFSRFKRLELNFISKPQTPLFTTYRIGYSLDEVLVLNITDKNISIIDLMKEYVK